MAAPQLLIIGNGMAATRLVRELVERGYKGCITLVGDEPGVGYNRIQLTPWLAGETSEAALNLVERDWYRQHSIRCVENEAVTELNLNGEATTASGRQLQFDHCVLATGAQPRLPELDFPAQPAIRAFRTKADGHWLKALPTGSKVVVLGGGLLGLEAAWGLRQRGHSVALVHRNGHLMNRQLSDAPARYLSDAFSAAGIELHLQRSLRAIDASPKLSGITLDDGHTLAADALITAAGIQPRIELAQRAGLATKRGILVDDRLATSQANISALGECAECDGRTIGLVNPAYHQAAVLAARLCGDTEAAPYRPSQDSTRLKISGLDVVSIGRIDHPEARRLTLDQPGERRCRRLHLLGDRLVGAEMIGCVDHADQDQQLIRTQTPISDARLAMLGEASAA
ncbi:FAD-dependent oxidoreductase [Saccharospirillum sp. HFRX-1]|uniref:NAD(P)/FAD-dependent oxidoreductase n=1 Tax=unclassified Saccharospirillum TaxID=2633430 RepID=UPI0037135396